MRFTNLALLGLLVILGISGVYSLFWTRSPWVMDIHRVTGVLLLVVLPWKVGIAWGSLRRGLRSNWDRGVVIAVSLILTIVALLVIGLGYAWYWRIGPTEAWLRQTVISWHWMIGLGLGVPLVFHIWQRWPKPKKVDFASRRAFFRIAAIGVVGLAGWRIGETLAGQRSLGNSQRRFTGSREAAAFSGNNFPITNNPGEGGGSLDPDLWRLAIEQEGVERKEIDLRTLGSMPASQVTATLDCTLGWYAAHRWQGVALTDLVSLEKLPSAHGYGVLLESESGYSHTIPFPEAKGILLATHVDGQALDPWHGAPLRAVVPTRRGWFWVKWLRRVAVVRM